MSKNRRKRAVEPSPTPLPKWMIFRQMGDHNRPSMVPIASAEAETAAAAIDQATEKFPGESLHALPWDSASRDNQRLIADAEYFAKMRETGGVAGR